MTAPNTLHYRQSRRQGNIRQHKRRRLAGEGASCIAGSYDCDTGLTCICPSVVGSSARRLFGAPAGSRQVHSMQCFCRQPPPSPPSPPPNAPPPSPPCNGVGYFGTSCFYADQPDTSGTSYSLSGGVLTTTSTSHHDWWSNRGGALFMHTPMPAPPWTASVQMRITTSFSTQIGGLTVYWGPDNTPGGFHFGSRTWSVSPGGVGYQTTGYGSGKVSIVAGSQSNTAISNFIGMWVWNRLSMAANGQITGSYHLDVSSPTPPASGWTDFITVTISSSYTPDRIALVHKTGASSTSTFEHRYWTLE